MFSNLRGALLLSLLSLPPVKERRRGSGSRMYGPIQGGGSVRSDVPPRICLPLAKFSPSYQHTFYVWQNSTSIHLRLFQGANNLRYNCPVTSICIPCPFKSLLSTMEEPHGMARRRLTFLISSSYSHIPHACVRGI